VSDGLPPMGGPPSTSTDSPAPTLRRATVRATLWTITTSLGTRFLGVIGTLVLTHFIAPYDYGEVSAATVLVLTANQLSTLNVGTYILAHPRSGRDVMFHATMLHLLPGFVASGVVWAVGWRFGATFDAPTLGRYLPGMVLSTALDRVLYMPERVLVRNMRFGALSISRAAGELTYTTVSIVAAVMGWGGMAIVLGNVARSVLRFIITMVYVNWRDWLQFTRLQWTIWRDMIRFGVPVAIGSLAGFGVRRWDNLLVSRFFGPAVLGKYNLAYNLADIPAVQVGEQISDVLQAAFSRIEGSDPRRALLRSLGVLAFVMTPMAVGVASIAPTLATAFFPKNWEGVGPMLMVLAVISFTRPISNTVGAYLQVRRQPLVVAVMDVVTLGLLMLALWTVGRLSPLWACAAVGMVFTARLLVWGWVLRRVEGVPLRDFIVPLLPPIVACVPLMAAVFGVHRAFVGSSHRYAVGVLLIEVVVGAAAYLGGAALVARRQLLELATLLRGGLGKAR
jgi:lipopolysaccharide exporter